MAKLKEVMHLAGILRDRLKDDQPNERLVSVCVEAVWPYIYPYGLLSYMQEHPGNTPEKIDRLKSDRIFKAVTGTKRNWHSFLIGICHTYRERHSLRRARIRLANKSIKKGALVSAAEMDDLAESFRRQVLDCSRLLEELRANLLDPEAAAEQSRVAVSLRNDENIPRFLRLSRYIDYDALLQSLPMSVLEELKFRYEKPTPRTLSFDVLQEYISPDERLWKQFKKRMQQKFNSVH
jgi:hypothetical protein